jgi:hypothetical protein
MSPPLSDWCPAKVVPTENLIQTVNGFPVGYLLPILRTMSGCIDDAGRRGRAYGDRADPLFGPLVSSRLLSLIGAGPFPVRVRKFAVPVPQIPCSIIGEFIVKGRKNQDS